MQPTRIALIALFSLMLLAGYFGLSILFRHFTPDAGSYLKLLLLMICIGVIGIALIATMMPPVKQNQVTNVAHIFDPGAGEARKAILERIGDINDPNRPRPLVSIELFFEGNNDPASIGYNLPSPPEPRDFYELLKQFRAREDVHDVLIEVKDLQDPDGWPASDSIWFITTAKPEQVRSWFPANFAPDEVSEGFGQSDTEPCEIPKGNRAVRAWYD